MENQAELQERRNEAFGNGRTAIHSSASVQRTQESQREDASSSRYIWSGSGIYWESGVQR